MTERTIDQLTMLIQCNGGQCPNHNCICYKDGGCGYKSILSKINTIIRRKFENK